MNRASFKVLSWIFLRHGNLTFGGGTATIAVLDREIIDQRNLVHRDQAALAFALDDQTVVIEKREQAALGRRPPRHKDVG